MADSSSTLLLLYITDLNVALAGYWSTVLTWWIIKQYEAVGADYDTKAQCLLPELLLYWMDSNMFC